MTKISKSDGIYELPISMERRPTTRNQLLTDLGPVIYYLRVGPLVKIGFTSNLAKRLKGYPPYTKILAWRTGGTVEAERAIHERLAEHTAAGREWYHPTPEVLAVVNEAREHCGLAKYAKPA